MKKAKLIFGISGGLVLISTAVILGHYSFSMLNSSDPVNVAYAVTEDFTLTLDSSNEFDFKYFPFDTEFNVKNYNNDDITFVYKRAQSTSGQLMTLSGGAEGGYLYNKFIDDKANYNGLDGITSIKVKFSTTNGTLILKTGKDDEQYSNSRKISSNQEILFDKDIDAPSHFRLENKSGAGAANDIAIEAITIKYHGYDYYGSINPDFEQIYGTQSQQNIGVNSSYSLNPNYNGGNKNYYKINYSSSENIKGEIVYHNNSNSTVKNTETFYLEKGNGKQFCTYLDAFRNSAYAKYEKTIETIKFTNVGHSSATFTLQYFGANNSEYTRGTIYTIDDGSIEVGISLRLGGAINSIRNISTSTGYNIKEYVTNSGEIKIRSGDNNPDSIYRVLANNPNLVNSFDLGREVQQSYYIGVDSSNGYTRGSYDGKSRDYNPVQAGDDGRNESQIVDFKVTKDVNGKNASIWLRTKACDWAKSNNVTNSYMENTYTIKNGLLYVTNRFVDFTGFTNYPFDDSFAPEYISNSTAISRGYNGKSTTFGYVGKQTIELPAFYVSHPLNYYSTVSEDSRVLVFDQNQGWNSNTTEQSHTYISGSNQNMVESGSYNGETTYRSSASKGKYHYATRIHPENWVGYFNEDKFGVAVYMPATSYNHEGNRHVFTSGNFDSSHSAKSKVNMAYLDSNYELKYNGSTWSFANFTLESYLTNNTNYMSTLLGFYPHEYVPLEWTYAVGADYLSNLRSKFNSISDINNNFSVWSGCEF